MKGRPRFGKRSLSMTPLHGLKESKRSKLADALLSADDNVISNKLTSDSMNENNLSDLMFSVIDTNNDRMISYSELDAFLKNN